MLIFLKFIYYSFIRVCERERESRSQSNTSQGIFGGQKTTSRSWFSLSMWVLEAEPLVYLLSHLAGLPPAIPGLESHAGEKLGDPRSQQEGDIGHVGARLLDSGVAEGPSAPSV